MWRSCTTMGVVANPRARRVMVYTWNFHPNLIASVRQHGAHGYLSKTLPARELVAVPEAVHTGEVVISDVPPRGRSAVGPDWPGRGEGLSDHKIDAGSRTQAVLWVSSTASLQTTTASNTGAAAPELRHFD